MTKTLYLLRHADASEKTSSGVDRERVLSQKGIKEAQQIAAFLERNTFNPDAIFCSAAARTRQTLMLISEKLPNTRTKIFFSDELYEAGHDDLHSAICGISDLYNTVMIIGHNPAISSVAAHVVDASVSMHTCGLAKIELKISSWQEAGNHPGTLVQYIDPSILNQNKTHA